MRQVRQYRTTPHAELVTGVDSGCGVVQDVTRPMHRFRPRGPGWRYLNDREDDGHLDARSKCCVPNDA